MACSLALLVAVVSLGSVQAPEPTIETLRARAQERMRQDLATYSADEVQKLEDLYQSANRNLRGPDAKAILQRVVKEYPKSNRAGSAALYLAQLSSGAEREAYLKAAIQAHGDTWYGDGAQVGALARVQLAAFYAADGRSVEARATRSGRSSTAFRVRSTTTAGCSWRHSAAWDYSDGRHPVTPADIGLQPTPAGAAMGRRV